MRIRFAAAAFAALALNACANDVGEDDFRGGTRTLDDAAREDALVNRYDVNNLLADAEITGGSSITADQVQDFLDEKGSYLAGYTDPTWHQTAAVLIVERSRSYDIHPIYMLARIQTESSLVASGRSSHLSAATGCGCPDGGGCAASYAGFGNQIECAAKLIRRYFTQMEDDGETVAEVAVGRSLRTLDPCTVTPANKATAALYTYTPWVGAYGQQCRTASIGGSSFVAATFHKYSSEHDWDTGAAPAAVDDPPATDAGTPPPADAGPTAADPDYCDGKYGKWCDGAQLVDCGSGLTANTEQSRTTCEDGCRSMPSGTPDQCW